MLKAIGRLNNKSTVFIGLSYGNLDKFRDQPGDTYIKIRGEQLGIDHDILIFSGRTEEELAEMLSQGAPFTIIRRDNG